MKKFMPVILAIAMLVAFPSLASAQEAAKYSFASAQGNKHIQVTPGNQGEGVIYFYNIDGNRITHITLEISQAPENWRVEIEPSLHDITVDIGGNIVTVAENLHVEPCECLPQLSEDVPEGMVCIAVPSRGFALAKAANIIIQVPETEDIGNQADITISAVAEWLGQSGAAAIKQTRDFDFTVEVISEVTDTEERIIDEGNPGTTQPGQEVAGNPGTTQPEPEAAGNPEVTQPEQQAAGKGSQWGWLVVIAAVAIVLLAIFVIFLERRVRG